MAYQKFTGEEFIDTELTPKLNDNFDAVRSGNAGTVFPTKNLVIGMKFFDTSSNKEYTLVNLNPIKWKKLGGTVIRRMFTLADWVKSGNNYIYNLGDGQYSVTGVGAQSGSSYKSVLIDVTNNNLVSISVFSGYVDYTEYNKE